MALDDLSDGLPVRAPSPIRVPKTGELVADRIRQRIIRGELREGDFLPPEGQLLVTLGVSRPTLREALRILETENLISVLRGSHQGARVNQPRVETASRYAGFVLQAQGVTMADIYEARLAIEPFAARRLAEEKSLTACALLQRQTDRLRALVEARAHVAFMIEVAEFHRLLVEVSGLKTLLFLTNLLQDVVARYQVQFFRDKHLPDDMLRKLALTGLKSFERLIGLIEAGHADQAESHWRLHLVNANATWLPRGQAAKIVDVLD